MWLFQIFLCLLAAATSLIASPLSTNISVEAPERSTIHGRDDGSIGGAISLGRGRVQWPYDTTGPLPGVSFILYCFANDAVKQAHEQTVYNAWIKWHNKLGGSASQCHGHRVHVEEYRDGNGNHPFCFKNGVYKEGDYANMVWNDDEDVPRDILAIVPTNRAWSSSRQGKWNQQYTNDFSTSDWNYMRLTMGPIAAKVETVVHELGHVFGFMHEHQRADRQSYIWVNCAAINGYTEMMDYNSRHNPSYDKDSICFSNLDFFQNYRKQASTRFYEAVAQILIDNNGQLGWTTYGYDVNSIMQYGSFAYAENPNNCMPTQLWGCPLTKWAWVADPQPTDPNHTKQVLQYIPENKEITDADMWTLRNYYPWIWPNSHTGCVTNP